MSNLYNTKWGCQMQPFGKLFQSYTKNRRRNQRATEKIRRRKQSSPDLFVETASTASLIERSSTVNPNFLSPETHN